MSQEIMDIDAAAEFLRIKKRTIYKLAKEGEIPAIKIGGQWRFSRQQLIDLFQNENSEAANEEPNPNEQGRSIR